HGRTPLSGPRLHDESHQRTSTSRICCHSLFCRVQFTSCRCVIARWDRQAYSRRKKSLPNCPFSFVIRGIRSASPIQAPLNGLVIASDFFLATKSRRGTRSRESSAMMCLFGCCISIGNLQYAIVH